MGNIMRVSHNSGDVKARLVRPVRKNYLQDIIGQVRPNNFREGWLRKYKELNWNNITRGLDKILLADKFGIPTCYGLLYAKLIRRDGDILDFGLISTRVVTTVGAAYVIDAFQNSVELEIMKFHGIGEGNTAEDIADTDLETELTTEYIVNNTRATGTTAEGASSNIYSSVGTNTVDASVAIVEHGLLNNASVGSGVLFDRSVFSAINMVSSDQLETTYQWTLAVGG